MEDSILASVRDALGIEQDSPVFDKEIIPLINTYLMTLEQLGVGQKAFSISDESTTWASFLDEKEQYEGAKTYVVTRVRLAFDPPASAHVANALTDLYKELEWRLSVQKDAEE